ncbi:PREDICTED: trypsin-7-like [Nicrophorus vespilloides]|uniref:Trypsin-7-like n=1 Tax=Nicrophorus vespilloides TaxID=110193 RepID=A0ABM1M4I2_NICVS|nr:PREDICTED: trypsin-7-like [Nicrophorus vespilloides]
MWYVTSTASFFTLIVAGQAFLPQLGSRIIGGESYDIEDVPYQLSLEYLGSHICGASILSKSFAITAAHCTYGVRAAQLKVRAGSGIVEHGGQLIPISRIHQHPDYNIINLDNDISILLLKVPIKLNFRAQPIALPNWSETIKVGTTAFASGWGVIKGTDMFPINLQAITISIIGHDTCQLLYENEDITRNMMCAISWIGKMDTCRGDSGGPLVSNGKLIGITSWGYGCARDNFPGVYTNVQNYRDFIWKKTNGLL